MEAEAEGQKRSHKKRASGGGRGDFGLDLPASRVRRNAQLAAHPRGVAPEAGHTLTVAAELFLHRMTDLAWEQMQGRGGRANLEYDDLAGAVARRPEALDFLLDVVPQRCEASDLLPNPEDEEEEEEEEGEGDEDDEDDEDDVDEGGADESDGEGDESGDDREAGGHGEEGGESEGAGEEGGGEGADFYIDAA